MHDPWTRVVRCESDGGIVASHTNTHDITLDGIDKVIDRASRASDN
jgi:hypothetical protein